MILIPTVQHRTVGIILGVDNEYCGVYNRIKPPKEVMAMQAFYPVNNNWSVKPMDKLDAGLPLPYSF